jgi:O-methyltransferase
MAVEQARYRVPNMLRRLLAPVRAPRVPEPWASAYTYSIVTPINLHFLDELVQRIGRLEIPGDIVECGVYQGGSAAILGARMKQLGGDRRLRLFDSFKGVKEVSDRDGEYSRGLVGVGATELSLVRSVLDRAGVPADRVEIVAGYYEDTFDTIEERPTALLHVDCDFYESVKLTLQKFFPTMPPGGIVVVNDYGTFKGAHEATDEFIEANRLGVEPVPIDPGAAYFQVPGDGYGGMPAAGNYPGWAGPVG